MTAVGLGTDGARSQGIAATAASLLSSGVSGVAVARQSETGNEAHYFGTLERGTPEPVGADTRFDLASVSKLFTTAVVMALADRGVLNLDGAVSTYLPRFAHPAIQLRQLLSHASGLPATSDLWRSVPDPAALGDRLLQTPLQHQPGTRHLYSCVGFGGAGMVAEAATGLSLSSLVEDLISGPLGLDSVSYGPIPPESACATEWHPDRDTQFLRGTVHDELARTLGGAAGNAGIFANAADLAAFGWMVAGNGESAKGTPVLSEAAVHRMLDPQPGPPPAASGYRQGLGWRLGFEELTGTGANMVVSHPGFTGTALVVDRQARIAVAVLTNAVHPTRNVPPRTKLLRPLVQASLGISAG